MDSSPQGVRARCAELSRLGVEFSVAATPDNLAAFELTPLGVPLTALAFLTADWRHDVMLRLWNQMDAYAFGPREMPMPNWVLVDHALMSSGLIMAACDEAALPGLLERFGVTEAERGILDLLLADIHALGYDGPVPIAGYCAAPTAERSRWMGWSMCSAIPHAGLGFAVKALGLETYRAGVVTGVTQYDNVSLRSHVKFGPARIESAIVDLHTAPGSLVYSSDLAAWRRGETPGSAEAREPDLLLSARDRDGHLELQRRIEAGARVEIVAPGLITGGAEPLVPICVSPVPAESAHA
ncbi:MAG TPA: hypothetical protein VFN48_10260 [Solirubrobacteraceae bacterium]|nr:hypothetical protein [Solirubrobacteraceae bacterium]